MEKIDMAQKERKDILILKQVKILSDYVSTKISCPNKQYGLWGQYVSSIDFIEDTCYAIQQFYELPNIERPILVYIGVLETLTIQLNVVKQLHEFIFSRIDNGVVVKNDLQFPEDIKQIRYVRNYLHHASKQTISGHKEKDNFAYVFISKNNLQDKFSLEYCWATSCNKDTRFEKVDLDILCRKVLDYNFEMLNEIIQEIEIRDVSEYTRILDLMIKNRTIR